MKNQIVFILFFLSLLFPTPVKGEPPLRRGLFVTVLEKHPVISSREEIKKLVQFAKTARIQTLFVQIYRANKAWFPSKLADDRPYQACRKALGEDPLDLLIREAHKAGIEVHAWINLLSLSQNENAPILRKYGLDILTRNLSKKRTLADYRIDNQYFLEPGDPKVRDELSNIIEEILRAYPKLDGIQFDYIRYPDKDPFYGYTKVNIERFKAATGQTRISEKNSAWKKWRRDQVTELLEQLVKRARGVRPKLQVSTTGCAPYARAYHEAFQDWLSWLDRGLVDFVTYMDYSPDPGEFQRFIAGVKKGAKDFYKVNIAVGAYKLIRSPDVFAKEMQICESAGGRGCVVFHYDSLRENPALEKPMR